MKFGYEIDRSETGAKNAWRLRLLEDNRLVSEIKYSITDSGTDLNEATRMAFLEAEREAKDWINSKKKIVVHKASPLLILGLVFAPIILCTLIVALLLPTIFDFSAIFRLK